MGVWKSRSLCQCFIVSSAGHPSRIRRIVNCYEHSRPFPSFALGTNWLPQRQPTPIPARNPRIALLILLYWPMPNPMNLAKVSSFFCQLLQICFNCLFHFHSVATRPFVFPAEHGTCCVGFFLHLPHPQRFSCASRVSFSLFFRPSRFRVLFAIREAALLLAPKSPKI